MIILENSVNVCDAATLKLVANIVANRLKKCGLPFTSILVR